MSVYNKILHERGLRLLGGIVGAAIMASAINLFIVPQGFYAGGAYGLCQVIRTLLVTRAGVNVPFDLAGLLYLLANLPMFYLAYRGLGRTFFAKATIVTVCNSIFSALIPSPAVPIIADPADRLPALLDGRDNTLVTERAIAAAVPEEFVTALVSKTLGELPIL